MWRYNTIRQHPALFSVASRVLRTTVSFSASEDVFSALKLLVMEKRSRLSRYLLEDTMVIWPLASDNWTVFTNIHFC